MEYYSAIKRNDKLKHATTWMNLENTVLKKPGSKNFILYDSFYIKYPEQVNVQGKLISG